MTLSSIVENISVEIWKWMYRTQKIPHGTAQETGLTSRSTHFPYATHF